ncbi:hypothetical protein OB446_026585 [Paenibacillus alvei]|nr:hypothetical protein [Paenibacillus alvei]EJW14052.1 hypothetical protein PAV_141p01580 [Paenibacillus alvei DSM 29]MEC0082692.1 hypothetical protein [Paenibacillus alvei]
MKQKLFAYIAQFFKHQHTAPERREYTPQELYEMDLLDSAEGIA